ncbi:MAG: 50S ribosomal protein L29 [Actinomycetota bacterium]|nr:50S ribosomal protein L29 [Actinomycetota bacterium]
MKPNELNDLSDDALLAQVRDARRELFGLRMKHATGELENTAALSSAKRDVARSLTLVRRRGLDINSTTTVRSATNG